VRPRIIRESARDRSVDVEFTIHVDRRKDFLNETARPYGIAVTLPAGDPMSAPHLLGADWCQWRWYETAEARDRALLEMSDHPRYYRKGDKPSVVFTKVDP